jgi:hypothetical protein
MIQLNLPQALAGNKTIAPHTGRQRVLDKILSSHDAILEFDPATGGSKEWAWYVLSCYFMVQQIPRARIGQRIQNFKVVAFPYTTLLGIALHSGSHSRVAFVRRRSAKSLSRQSTYLPLVLIVDFGLHRARKTCASISVSVDTIDLYFDNSRLIDGNSTTRRFFH